MLPHHSKVLFQLADGLAYIHSMNLIHGEIKPENVLISVDPSNEQKVTMKWTDFGLCRLPNERRTLSFVVREAFNWLAPELLKQLDGKSNYETYEQALQNCQKGTVKSDVFAEGLVFGYYCRNGFHPYGTRYHEIQTNLRKKQWIGWASMLFLNN